MHIEESKRVLRSSSLFCDLNEIHLDLILMVCEESSYRQGEVIFHQDAPGDALYIIARGEVEIFLLPFEPGGDEVSLAVLKENDSFGETILVEAGVRSAGARGHTDVQLLRLPRERLVRLTEDYPDIGFRIMRRMAAELTVKLRDANLHLRERLFWKPDASGTPETT